MRLSALIRRWASASSTPAKAASSAVLALALPSTAIICTWLMLCECRVRFGQRVSR